MQATNTSLFVTYLVTISVLMLTPGPDMLFCLATGLRSGPRAGLSAAAGAATGEIVHFGLSAAGLAAIFRAAPPLFEAVRLAGAAYLVWLGISALRSRGRDAHRGAVRARAARPPHAAQPRRSGRIGLPGARREGRALALGRFYGCQVLGLVV